MLMNACMIALLDRMIELGLGKTVKEYKEDDEEENIIKLSFEHTSKKNKCWAGGDTKNKWIYLNHKVYILFSSI